MNRSNYTEDCENFNLYRRTVERAINCKKGQAFLLEMAHALDSMPVKELIAGDLVDSETGACCAIGAVCKSRGLDTAGVDIYCPTKVGELVGIATCLAAEVEDINDVWNETAADRWKRVMEWVCGKLLPVELANQ